MKKLISFTLLFVVLLFTSQLNAQVEIKSKSNQKASDKKSETNDAGTKPDDKIMMGGYTKSGKKISPPRTTQEPGKNSSGTVTVGPAKNNPPSTGLIVYDRMGNVLATIGNDGMIYDAEGKVIARYSSKGEYLRPDGEKLGSIQNGVIRRTDGKELGRMSNDGRVTNAKGKFLGTISEDGTIRNRNGSRLGSAPGVDKNISVMIFFHRNKLSSGEKKQNRNTKPGFESRPIQK